MPNNDLDILMKFIEAHIRGLKLEIERVKESQENNYSEIMEMFQRAFPEGDLPGHQRFHQQLMDEARTRADIRNEILKKLVAGSVWSAVVFAGYKIIDALKEYLNVFHK